MFSHLYFFDKKIKNSLEVAVLNLQWCKLIDVKSSHLKVDI